MVTIYEIAEKAGVSPKTAARILSGETKRSRKQEEVQKWANELGYVRNASAAKLRTGKSGLVGLLVPFIDNPYYTQLIQTFHDQLASRGMRMLVLCSFGKTEEVNGAFELFRSYGVDGVFCVGSEGPINEKVLGKMSPLQDGGYPVTLIGREEGEFQVDQADVENAAGMRLLVDHLIEKGHQNMGFIGGREQNRTMQARAEGFVSSVKDRLDEVSTHSISWGEATAEDAGKRAFEMLKSKDLPTALLCGNDLMALGVLKALLSEGIKIPEDVAVTGFDDIPTCVLVEPSLTTLRQPIARLAEDCVDLFVRRFERKEKIPLKRFAYVPELVVRDST